MPASLVATCKTSDVNPVDDIAATLRAIPDGHPKGRIEDPMPRRLDQPSTLAAQGNAVALAPVMPSRRPRSRSAGRTQPRNVSPPQPIFAAIGAIAAHGEASSP